jgi:hypothetical protein
MTEVRSFSVSGGGALSADAAARSMRGAAMGNAGATVF